MTPEEKELLKRTAVLVEENNKMLHSIRNSMRWARVMSILYWVFIIGSAVGAYYLIQPYIDAISGGIDGTRSTVSGALDTLKNISNVNK